MVKRSIFSDAHVAGENDRIFFRRPAAKLCEAFRETEAGGAPKRTACDDAAMFHHPRGMIACATFSSVFRSSTLI